MSPSSSPRPLNADLPVAQLPDDILLDIFKTYRADCYELETSADDPSRYDWLRVAQVCHHWRLLFVNTSSMWSDVSFPCDPTLSANMLRRSGEAPLAIRWDRHTWTEDECNKILAPQLHRVRHLELTTQRGATEAFLRACASSPPNPHLTFLRIGLRVPRSGCTVEPSGLLTGTGAPNLRTFILVFDKPLSLRGISFTARLARLVLHQNRGARGPAADWYTLLASAPHLRDLWLHGILPDTRAPQPLALPHLAKLDVRDTPARVAHFLASIHTPAVRHTLLDCRHGPGGTAQGELAPAIAAHLRDATGAPPFTELAYAESTLENDVGVRVVLAARAGEERVRRLDVEFRYADADAQRVPHFVSALPLGGVTRAELTVLGSGEQLPSAVARPEDDYAAWRTAFGGMRALEELVVHSHCWEFADDHFLGRNGLRQVFPRLQSVRTDEDTEWKM
ncbi:hypothetical protein PsYK624_122420 [Phanerochaete sordida]|uniref:F-box domain-containing protein n=1 Tax=Phanerochaete sordida TaxID=48140 RepID=A0A9P3GMA3_9APHY|nr:hypothetical protein PsYK624_122420 [Phanerochaete sordida]